MIRSRITAMAVAALACASCAVASPAVASTVFADHVQLASGASWWGGPNVTNVTAVSVTSYGVAYSGAWISNASGVRVSALNYCETPGCTAGIGWPAGSQPSGYGTAHNHGNASVSYFAGVID